MPTKTSGGLGTELSFLEDELSALDDVLKGIGDDLQDLEQDDASGQTPPGSNVPVPPRPPGTKTSIPAAPPLPRGAPPPPSIPGSTQSKTSAGSSRGDLLSEIEAGKRMKKSISELKLDSLGPPPSFVPASPPVSPPPPMQPTAKAIRKKRPTAEPGRFQGIQSIVKKEDDGVPSWKKRVVAGRHAKVQADRNRKHEEEKREAEKFEGVPEWKKKLMDKKQDELDEKMKPQRQKQQEERELREKLAAMPPWKQELFRKKNNVM